MKNKIYYLFITLSFTAVTLTSCKDDDSDPYEETKAAIMETYANIAFAAYEDSYEKAGLLHDAIDEFVDNPTQDRLDAAKAAWLAAREPYGQTEAYRFANGPIDNDEGPEGILNSWPLDEAHIDYVEGDATAGIINNVGTYPDITDQVLLNANQNGAEENVSVGYHAIEFLLWGQDMSAVSAGTRPYTDYVTNGTSADNEARRADYLSTCAHLLLESLAYLKEQWDPNVAGNYRASFLASDQKTALKDMLNGLVVLSGDELPGERIFTAYDNQDQEDEQSCFSDNTHRDIILNAKGVDNIYRGIYTRTDGTVVSGTSFNSLFEEINHDLADEVIDALEASEAAVTAIPAPFDQAIIDAQSRPLVLDAVTKLQAESNKLIEAAALLDITINL